MIPRLDTSLTHSPNTMEKMATHPAEPASGRMSFASSLPPQKARSRTHSLSSDRTSTIGAGFMSPPLAVSPEAAFIAAAAASQIVTNDHDAHQDTWYDQQGIEPPSEIVLVSPAALALINNFLDRLLFNLLYTAKSTSLAALRPAVAEVLKPKLAKDAIYQADEELQEYLGGGDDEDYGSPTRPGNARDWDLELVWKRTRLRCMVYSSLGDLEEEDEDFHMEQENLLTGDETVEETISPAVAIFLTSILEFMGEQALIVAGQAAFQRMRHQYEKSLREGTPTPVDMMDRIAVGDSDVERIALDRTLGRLWRSWKKQLRSPTLTQESTFRNLSRDSGRASSTGNLRWRSLSIEPQRRRTDGSVSPMEVDEETAEPDDGNVGTDYSAASVPLPMGPDDILEILIPGLAHDSDYEGDTEDTKGESLPRRPRSMLLMPGATGTKGLPTSGASELCTPKLTPRKRASSLPTPAASSLFSLPMNNYANMVMSSIDISEDASSEPVNLKLETEKLSGVGKEALAIEVSPVSPMSSNPVATDSRAGKEPERPTIQQRRMSSAQIAAIIAGNSGSRSPGLPARSPGVPAISPGLPMTPEQAFNDEAEEIEEFCEEPEILTTSRISVSGRSNSPTTSEHSKPAITIGIPKRSASVHSVRMIEVATPRSPMSRSRNSSADAQERTSMRGSSLSRTDPASAFTPPIREEGARQTSPSRKGYPFPTKPTRLQYNDSISEAEESTGSPLPSMSVSTLSSRTSTPLEQKPAASFEELEARTQSQPPTIFTVPRDSDSPVRNSPATKVTIVSSSSSGGGSIYHEHSSSIPSKSTSTGGTRADVPHPPERSARRPLGSTSSSPIPATSIGRVSVERSSPKRRGPSQSREPIEPPRERSSTPLSVEKVANRNHHDSVSTISSLQQRLKAVRASQDSTRPVEVKTFDELIQSDETIQYTLTPENMRDIDSLHSGKNDSPVMRPKSRKGEEFKLQEHSRSASTPTGAPRAAEIKRSASVSKASALSSHPILEGAPLSGPIPRAPGLMSSRSHGAGPQARDARIPLESLSEFADFIRATGPPGAGGSMGTSRTQAPMVAKSTTGPAAFGSKRSLDSNIRAATNTSSSRMRYQARDATIDPREDNSDLIDFIRRGPQTSGNPRIPRTVAPFRTTMDSDQFATAAGGKAVDATLPDIRHSAASTSITENSVPSSINSQSALLRKDKSMAGARGGQSNANMFDEEDMIPKRKQRRVRDPYAIDFSDEEDDFDEMPSKPARRLQPPVEREETLAEFLMNVPPPQNTNPVPLSVPAQNHPTPKKKSSTASLMARFTRRDSTRNDRKVEKETNKLTKQPDTNSIAPQSRAGGGRGYVPIQVNLPPGINDYGAIPARPKTTGSSGRVPMRKFEPREAVPVPNRATSELADFLRNSEPPRTFGPAGYGGENSQRLPKQFIESGHRLPKQFAQG